MTPLNQPTPAPGPFLARERRPVRQESDFRDHLLVLWSGRYLLVALAAAGAIVGFAWSRMATPTYEASLMLAAGQSKMGDDQGLINTANFRPVVYNFSTATAVVQKFRLDQPPYNLDGSRFLERVLSVTEMRGTNLIRVQIRLRDPKLAADVANEVARLSTELARQLSQTEAVQVRDDIKVQVDEAHGRMQEADAAYVAFRRDAKIDVLKSQMSGLLKEREGQAALDLRIAEERAKLASAEKELAGRERLTSLNRTIDDALPLMETVRRTGNDVVGMRMKTEVVNSAFDEIDRRVAETRSDLAGLERKRDRLQGLNDGRSHDDTLRRLYEAEGTLSRLEVERDLARKVYADVATQYENARMKVASRSAQLQAIDPAFPPSTPMPRYTVRNTAGGGLLGFMGGAGLLFLLRAARPHDAVGVDVSDRHDG